MKKAKKEIIEKIENKYNLLDKKRLRGKKTKDPTEGQLSLGLFIADEKRKDL